MVWFAGRGKVKESPDTDFISTDQPGLQPSAPNAVQVQRVETNVQDGDQRGLGYSVCPMSLIVQRPVGPGPTGWAAAQMPTMEKEKGRPFTWTRCSRTSRS